MILYWRHSGHAVFLGIGSGTKGITNERKRPSQIFLTAGEVKYMKSEIGEYRWEHYYRTELVQCIESQQVCDIVVAVEKR